MDLMTKEKKSNTFMILSIIFCFFLMLFFYMDIDFYCSSDNVLHAEWAVTLPEIKQNGLDAFVKSTKYPHILSYPMWHGIFLIIQKVISLVGLPHPNLIAEALLNSSLVTLTYALALYLLHLEKNKRWWLALGITFAGPLYLPALTGVYYLGQFTPNPWHNPTTLMVKPFALLCFYSFSKLLEAHKKQEDASIKLKLVLTFSMFFSAIAKPSFYQVFFPAVFFYAILDLFINHKTLRDNFLFWAKTLIYFLPTVLIAFIQFYLSFEFSGNGGIEFAWMKVWNWYSPNWALSLAVSILFPALAIILYFKHSIDKPIIIMGIIEFILAILQFCSFSLVSKFNSGDFSWGVYLSLYLLFFGLILYFPSQQKYNKFSLRMIIVYTSLFLHIISGTYYFIRILIDGTYRI